MFATAGNLSFIDPESGVLWITASGKDKGNLKESDFLALNYSTGAILEDTENRPSAETVIHRTIYSRFKNAAACLHVHTPTSCILEFGLSTSKPTIRIQLPNTEIIKAFGNFAEEPNLSVIVVHNFGDVSKIAAEFDKACAEKTPDVPFFLIENHGITVWGKNVADANKNLEASEFILQVLLGRRAIKSK